jgi:formate dehydrogenase iron-sulfur subunit
VEVIDTIMTARKDSARMDAPTLPGRLAATLNSRAPARADPSLGAQTELLRDLCNTMKFGSLCALGGFTPYPVLSALDYFPEDFGSPAPVAEAVE